MVPVRGIKLGLAEATYWMLPLPAPLAPWETTIHGLILCALHGASGVAKTAMLP